MIRRLQTVVSHFSIRPESLLLQEDEIHFDANPSLPPPFLFLKYDSMFWLHFYTL